MAGTDYTATSGTFTFAPGETSKGILVPTLDDGGADPTRYFTVNLSNPTGGVIASGQGIGTILDDTKFYVVDGGSSDSTYQYASSWRRAGQQRPGQRRHRPARRRDHRGRHHRMGRGRQQERLRLQHRRRPARLLVGRRPEFLRASSPASPPTAPTSGWWIATPTRSTSTPAPPAGSPAARMRPAVSASSAAGTATPIPRTS